MFEVVDPGALSTVQDGGRPGHPDLGGPGSGARPARRARRGVGPRLGLHVPAGWLRGDRRPGPACRRPAPPGARPDGGGGRAPLARRPPGAPLRLIPAADPAGLAPGALAAIVDSPWIVSTESDRVGVRLSGPAITAAPEAADLVSRGVVPGTMQLPPGGPIILLADGPTVGGYPVAGVVARAALPRAAPAPPGA